MIRIAHNPSQRQLAVFSLLWLMFFGVLGAMAWWRSGSFAAAGRLWAAGALVPAAGLIWPGLMRLVYLGAAYMTWPIGFLLSYIILAVVYYLVMTPIGLVLRLRGYDPMQRSFDRNAKTYWAPREQEDESTDKYFLQF